MKRIFFCLSFSCFLLYLLFFPETAVACARAGLMLWFNTLLPSMLPFMILSGIFMKAGFIEKLLALTKGFWKSVFHLTPMGGYGLLIGIFCGYPMGAKTAADLYQDHRISRQEACYLLTFSNHPGPAFLSSYLCVELLHREWLILPAYGILYLSSFFTSLLFRRCYSFDENSLPEFKRKEASAAFSWGEALDASIMNSFLSITKLGGYIILFSVLLTLLQEIPWQRSFISALAPTLEVTNGILLLKNTVSDINICYPAVTGLTAFGGFCSIAQTQCMLSGTDLRIFPYIIEKLAAAAAASLLAVLYLYLSQLTG